MVLKLEAEINENMIWPNGGMVDTTDLKSVIRNGCEGSSPSSATKGEKESEKKNTCQPTYNSQ